MVPAECAEIHGGDVNWQNLTRSYDGYAGVTPMGSVTPSQGICVTLALEYLNTTLSPVFHAPESSPTTYKEATSIYNPQNQYHLLIPTVLPYCAFIIRAHHEKIPQTRRFVNQYGNSREDRDSKYPQKLHGFYSTSRQA